MSSISRRSLPLPAAAVAAQILALTAGAAAQTAQRDGIADLLGRKPEAAGQLPPAAAPPAGAPGTAGAEPAPTEAAPDPPEGEANFEQAQRLMKAVDAILQDTARNRGEAKKLPSDSEFLMKPLWTETREDREKKVRDLMDAALGIVTDV